MMGHCLAGAVKRELGCAACSPLPAYQGLRSQEMRPDLGGSEVMPSHQGLPSASIATFVKMELEEAARRAMGLVLAEVPGATPK